MYNDLLSIGKFTIHGYGLMIGIGFVLAVLLGAKYAKRRGLSEDAVFSFALLAILSGFGGGKLLYILTEWKQFIASPRSVLGSSGFVVYGGLIAAVVCTILYARIKKLDYLQYLDALIPFVALAQGFGRIGCFLAGCCYGKPTTCSIGIVFPQGSIAPAGVSLLPTQLFSSLADFLLCAFLLLLAKKVRRKGIIGATYCIAYGVGRFILEYFRGDDRGEYIGPFSISQFISLFIVAFGLLCLIFLLHHKQKNACDDKAAVTDTVQAPPPADATQACADKDTSASSDDK
ncbi:MAG: prolipoprotein diacylglyceryl transferase [Eubacteriales bacterium]|nr:prolipoprotein diacylglyceryl transferase [Eubacteriales bacterium]